MAPELKVSEVATDYYQIDTSPFTRNRWWTARKLASGWYITNNRSTVIKQTSLLGRQIIKAIEEFCREPA